MDIINTFCIPKMLYGLQKYRLHQKMDIINTFLIPKILYKLQN